LTLTLGDGPLAGSPPDSNFDLDGPAHKLLFSEFPRRVRGRVNGATVVDTTRGRLMHETGLLPVFYAPIEDLDHDLLAATGHSTHCPFKGDASYWSVRVGEHEIENAIWHYPEPIDSAEWLKGYAGFYWDKLDGWLDEEQELPGKLRDPYHRVDVRSSSRHVRVVANGETVAESHSPMVLFETGIGLRFYLPPQDVRRDLLTPTETRTLCPYKGRAHWWSLSAGGETIEDAAWGFPEPLDEARQVRDHFAFYGEGIAVEVDGVQVE
jgi:uncharacterized protein (DUF427 family)